MRRRAEPSTTSRRREAVEALRDLGLRPRRRLGQSFLVDRGFAERIVGAAQPEGRTVLEIGPGLGALSDPLAARAARLVLVEVDAALADRLRRRFEGVPTVAVVRADALDVDLDRVLPDGARALVVANLPYSVGSQILLRLLEERRRFSALVLMLQREVVARITASPGNRDYGLLSVWTGLYGEPRILFHVPARAFFPQPKVESSVLRIGLRDAPRVRLDDPQHFARIVRASFGQRRKTLGRALRGVVAARECARDGSQPGRRGETLSLEEFARLSAAADGASVGAGAS